MTISILGCGWYGKALGQALAAKNFEVKGSVTSADKLASLASVDIKPFKAHVDADKLTVDAAFFDCDVLVVSIPPRFRKGEAAAYLPKLTHIIEAIKQYEIKKVIYISSTGVYGDTNSEVNELIAPQPEAGTGIILFEAENLFENETAFATTILRFGGLIGPGRDPANFFSGKTGVPNGQAPVNLIHLYDCVSISEAIINKGAFGYVFNACSPEHPSKAVFYRSAATRSGVVLPEFVDELKSWNIVNSVNLQRILDYKFKVSLNMDYYI